MVLGNYSLLVFYRVVDGTKFSFSILSQMVRTRMADVPDPGGATPLLLEAEEEVGGGHRPEARDEGIPEMPQLHCWQIQ